MTVLDLGCGPGFFSVALAQIVSDTGKVIAVDLQEGMLQKLKDKIKGTELENRITLHKCEEDKIGCPASHGCIRMMNADVIELYDLVSPGCPVSIEE